MTMHSNAAHFLKYTPLLILAAVISTPFIWGSDSFQEVVFPESYWRKQINLLEADSSSYRDAVATCQLELQKSLQTANIDAAQLRLQGVPPEQVAETVRSAINAVVDVCRTMQNIYAQNQKELNQARTQFARHSRNP